MIEMQSLLNTMIKQLSIVVLKLFMFYSIMDSITIISFIIFLYILIRIKSHIDFIVKLFYIPLLMKKSNQFFFN